MTWPGWLMATAYALAMGNLIRSEMRTTKKHKYLLIHPLPHAATDLRDVYPKLISDSPEVIRVKRLRGEEIC